MGDLGSNLHLEIFYFPFFIIFYTKLIEDLILLKMQVLSHVFEQNSMFFLWPGLRKKTVLLLSPVTLRVAAVAALMSFSGPSAPSFFPSSTHPGDLILKNPSKSCDEALQPNPTR